MAKTVSKHTPRVTWVLPKVARERMAAVLGSIGHAERWIIRELPHIRRQVVDSYPSDEPHDWFWRDPLPPINWVESSTAYNKVAAKVSAEDPMITFTTITVYFCLAWEDIAARIPANSMAATAATVAPPPSSKKEWFAKAKQQHPRRPGEGASDYADRLMPILEAALGEKAWSKDNLVRRLYDPDE